MLPRALVFEATAVLVTDAAVLESGGGLEAAFCTPLSLTVSYLASYISFFSSS
jgi:hypothetical protein